MTLNEYFKDWIKVIDKKILSDTLNTLSIEYKNNIVCPSQNDVFKVFQYCPYNELKIIILGQDPYPQKGIATGIAFGNSANSTDISPSLQVLKESVINFEVSHNCIIFDQTLEEWCKQGVFLLNSALTCKLNEPGSHSILWRPFISTLLTNICKYNTGIIYVLMGNQAKTFLPYINKKFNTVIETDHPAFCARRGTNLCEVFKRVNTLLHQKYGESIIWYKEN